MLLGKEEWDSDQDGTGRQETHQDPVRLQQLSLGGIPNGIGDTKRNGRADDLKRGSGDVQQIVELRSSVSMMTDAKSLRTLERW
jgi:hypothetical protein